MRNYDADHIPVFVHGLETGWIWRTRNGWETSKYLAKVCKQHIISDNS